MKTHLYPFHLAMPVADLKAAMDFYESVLGLERGRHTELWADYDFFGHQVVFHQVAGAAKTASNPVDGDDVPVPHFGVVLDFPKWEEIADRFERHGSEFMIRPSIRFKNKPGKQGTFFIKDPNGLCLEFKAFKDPETLFKGK